MPPSVRVFRPLLVFAFLGIASFALAGSSEQLIFSGTGSGTFTPAGGTATNTPFGFWIWCEADSSNGYVGECNGAMYFYKLGITRAVEDAGVGAIQELSEGIYRISVVSKKDNSIACTLTNQSDNHGPNNLIDVSCSAPAGAGQAKGVVNVTGP